MKSLIAALAFVVSASPALADGFRCQTAEQDLNIQIFNKTSGGTRNAAIMVLSDPFIQYGNKTIATFNADNSLLGQTGATYVANVDLRYSGSGRGGENIGGTKLMYLKHIVVSVDFTYARPVTDGTLVTGTISYLKRNGEDSFQEITCVRYLKGE